MLPRKEASASANNKGQSRSRYSTPKSRLPIISRHRADPDYEPGLEVTKDFFSNDFDIRHRNGFFLWFDKINDYTAMDRA
jgi:hypothetical protein